MAKIDFLNQKLPRPGWFYYMRPKNYNSAQGLMHKMGKLTLHNYVPNTHSQCLDADGQLSSAIPGDQMSEAVM